MADTKTSAESAAATLDGTELVRIVQTGSSVRTTTQDIADLGGSSAFSGASVTKAADQTAANYTTLTAIAWDSEVYDEGGWHESVTNPSRLTVPAGVFGGVTGYVTLTAAAYVSSLANEPINIRFYKNGAILVPTIIAAGGTNGGSAAQATGSMTVAASEGDYFEVFLFVTTDTSVSVLAAFSFFDIKRV